MVSARARKLLVSFLLTARRHLKENGSGLAHDETLGISLRKPESP
jgi:hypothetical protein